MKWIYVILVVVLVAIAASNEKVRSMFADSTSADEVEQLESDPEAVDEKTSGRVTEADAISDISATSGR